jgi:hypothetical protein
MLLWQPRASQRSRVSACDFLAPECQGPHPRRSYGRSVGFEDAADNSAVRQHIEIVVIPVAGWAVCRRSSEYAGFLLLIQWREPPDR